MDGQGKIAVKLGSLVVGAAALLNMIQEDYSTEIIQHVLLCPWDVPQNATSIVAILTQGTHTHHLVAPAMMVEHVWTILSFKENSGVMWKKEHVQTMLHLRENTGLLKPAKHQTRSHPYLTGSNNPMLL